jgi:adenylylsulfate kinase-like enzyme
MSVTIHKVDLSDNSFRRKVLAGEIICFSGVSNPYEQPIRPKIYIDSENQPASVESLIDRLEDLNCRPRSHNRGIPKSQTA